jgi:hypothetical protein
VDNTLTSVDVTIMLYICYGYIFTVLSIFTYRTRRTPELRVSIIGSFVRLSLTLLINIYAAWFWIHGLHHTVPNKCRPIVWFFAELSILGNVRFVLAVASILMAVYYAFLLSLGLMSVCVWGVTLVIARFTNKKDFNAKWNTFWAYTRRSLAHDTDIVLDHTKY